MARERNPVSSFVDPIIRGSNALREVVWGNLELSPKVGQWLRSVSRTIDHSATDTFAHRLLVGSGLGLLLYDHGEFIRLLRGTYYGITRGPDRWYAFRKLGPFGELLSFKLEGREAVQIQRLMTGLSREIHQIDWFDGALHVCDTARNRVLSFDIDSEGVRSVEHRYPEGQDVKRRGADGYVHLNSIHYDGSTVRLIYHNDSYQTGKRSEIAETDLDFDVHHRSPAPAKCAHNIVPFRSRLLYCDSLGDGAKGRLMWGESPVFEAPSFLRGLAVANDCIVVGGSDFSNRVIDGGEDGYLYLLDHDFQKQAEMHIPGANPLQEVRFVDRPDRGLSRVAATDSGDPK